MDEAQRLQRLAELAVRVGANVQPGQLVVMLYDGFLRFAAQGQAALASGALAATKPLVARYFAEHLAPEARGLKRAALAGASLLYALDAEALAG